MFKLFQNNKNFRLGLFILLSFFVVTLGGCGDKLSFGFPTVYYSNEEVLFESPVNLIINIIIFAYY